MFSKNDANSTISCRTPCKMDGLDESDTALGTIESNPTPKKIPIEPDISDERMC